MTHTLFAVAILDDIRAVISENSRKAFEDMKSFANQSWDRIQYATDQTQDSSTRIGPSWRGVDADLVDVIEMRKDIVIDGKEVWSNHKAKLLSRQPDDAFYFNDDDIDILNTILVLGGAPVEASRDKLDNLRSLPAPYILPSKSCHIIWTGNPMAIGTMAFNLLLVVERAGIVLANVHLSILLVSYFYVALR
jgi:hypothetical protein